ncbi:hypothetical protein [Qipengyuania nanhaisediminis]|uniref:Uncharacterized protein n=1 Tax=Qipengyuania nanhaisediminis TaxID=604088 RepID=A0A1I5KP97_9SPHN|nr:hypothetical protein [Qipengyuania nanhaisediminis]SFO86371.1 hypothetical protein SAMN04488060_0385 [Qipengyuania nanhaisediminis]
MIDYFAIFLTHGLIVLVCWRLLAREDLDDPLAAPPPAPGKPGTRKRRRRDKGRGGDV